MIVENRWTLHRLLCFEISLCMKKIVKSGSEVNCTRVDKKRVGKGEASERKPQ